MSLADLTRLEVEAAEERARQRDARQRRALERDAHEAVSRVLVRGDGTLASLSDPPPDGAGLTQHAANPDGTHVWHDGTTGLLARQQGRVWAVYVARRGGPGWRPVGQQVHSLADIAERLAV